MAANLLKIGSKNSNICEFVVDTEEEIGTLPTSKTPGTAEFLKKYNLQNSTIEIGSTCIVGNNSGELMVYMLFGFGWKKI